MSSEPTSPRPAAPARSLNRQQILDEDEYTEALSEIIARDFFPSLVHLDATNSYLDALQTQDTKLINQSVRRLQDLSTPRTSQAARPLQTPGRTPYGSGFGDTPAHTPHSEIRSSKRPRYDTSLSLDSFQAKYTSEDNASFTEILDDENRIRKEKWSWAWDAQKRAQGVKAIENDRRSRLLIEDTTTQPPGVRERLLLEVPDVKLITSGIDNSRTTTQVDKHEASRATTGSLEVVKSVVKSDHVISTALLKTDDNAEIDVMARRKDTRSAAVDGWSFKTRNSLMFAPDADRSPYDGASSLPTSEAKGPPKVIKHGNTRLPEQSNEDGNEDVKSTAPSSPTASKIGAAIAGTPYVSRGERDSFPLLPNVPSPTPSQLGSAAVNKLMTWGTITATPRILSSDNHDLTSMEAPATPFHLPGPSPREKVAHKLSSTASRSLRAKASLLSGTPGPSSGRRQTTMNAPGTPRGHPGLLTPAARRLLDRTAGLGTSASRRAEAMRHGSGWEGVGKTRELRDVRWTPSPNPVSRKIM
ncbi:nuclear protein DGCR14 [Hysterangium stoloniferum]|nr:nuclear protein DGCR14 [Hysterangium stoloniferum]